MSRMLDYRPRSPSPTNWAIPRLGASRERKKNGSPVLRRIAERGGLAAEHACNHGRQGNDHAFIVAIQRRCAPVRFLHPSFGSTPTGNTACIECECDKSESKGDVFVIADEIRATFCRYGSLRFTTFSREVHESCSIPVWVCYSVRLRTDRACALWYAKAQYISPAPSRLSRMRDLFQIMQAEIASSTRLLMLSAVRFSATARSCAWSAVMQSRRPGRG